MDTKTGRGKAIFTPDECIEMLPEPTLLDIKTDVETTFLPAELRHSLLAISGINHEAEAELVRRVVSNALGRLPEIEE